MYVGMKRAVAVAVLTCASALGAGCGDSGGAATTTPAVSTNADAATIEVSYKAGAITGGGRHSVKKGQTVTIKVTSDIADELHLHGYDKSVEFGANQPATLVFTADKPGVYEAELEHKGLKLFDLEVK